MSELPAPPAPPTIRLERVSVARFPFDVLVCSVCAALVFDRDDAAEAHRAWHDAVVTGDHIGWLAEQLGEDAADDAWRAAVRRTVERPRFWCESTHDTEDGVTYVCGRHPGHEGPHEVHGRYWL
jgi:hypothetical protein